MNSDELRDFHYVAHIANLPSIIQLGLLSHNRMETLEHRSIADESVQDRRRMRKLPTGRYLHEYVNMYIDARNPMLYRISQGPEHRNLCVIEVSKGVRNLPGVVITDGNAASGSGVLGTRFYSPEQGVRSLRTEDVYCQWWTSADPHEKQERVRKRMAEVLVPDRVPPSYFKRIVTSCTETKTVLERQNHAIIVESIEHMFFR